MARNTSEAKVEKKKAVLKCPACDQEGEFYWTETVQASYTVEIEGGEISVDKSCSYDSDEQYSGFECGQCYHSFATPPNTEVRFDY